MKRGYASSLRDQAKQDTKDRILDAMVDVVTREGVHAFTVQNVANAAGVAHRTVYRHFATREALLDGLDALIERRAAEMGIVSDQLGQVKVTDLPAMVGPGYRSFDVLSDAMRAYVVISVALGRRVPGFDKRTRALRESLAKAYPALGAHGTRDAAGIIRLLFSTRTWFHLTSEMDMTTDVAARAVSWAIEALLADLAARSKKRR